MERFGDRRFISVDDPRFLDYEGAEIVLIGAAEDVDAELGVEPKIDDEDLDLLQDLDLDPKDPPSEPLERGELR
jgi:hypothetical protein